VLGSTSPFFVAGAEWLVFGSRPSWRTIAGIVIGFVGVVVIVYAQSGSGGGSGDTVGGLSLALVAAVAWAAGTLVVGRLVEREPDMEMLGLTAGQYAIGGLVLVPISLVAERGGDADWSEPRLWWAVAFVSIVGSALATVAYLSALRVIDPTRASTWLFMAPVIAVVLDTVLGDPPEPTVLVGMALTITGVAVVSRPPAD
jgi:drug/metabolite transporter (DMT)-like permease